ncbi:melanophilin [Nematolebias whitei]|uniref:melanophilin n=1 Tax=Nematolebias whitei TaxID=451745 RepID=UPI00189949D8|nr:melanophilin [Nematolebias whitei]
MLGSTAGRKLDLSELTDEEAKHVWDVVQRDFHLRRKEEDRLGELKTKIEREDTKRELLGNQTSLTEFYCIRCLQPFKFLVSIKRQCLDCRLHVCQSCCRYNKKERGWVCEPCHMTRVLQIGTLEWYHENVRARFKRFGSAKVVRSLFRRLSGEHGCSQSDLGESCEYDARSTPDVHNGFEEHSLDSRQFKGTRKTKRRLTVDPVDFRLGCERSDRRRQDQKIRTELAGGLHCFLLCLLEPKPPPSQFLDGPRDVMDRGQRSLRLVEADMAAGFNQKVQEQHRDLDLDLDLDLASQHDDLMFVENKTVPSRSASRLSYSSWSSGGAGGLRGGGGNAPGLYDSDPEDDLGRRYPVYLSHPGPDGHTSQEGQNPTSSPPQITDLNRRMSAVETLLSRLELKVASSSNENLASSPQTPTPPQGEEVDLEEQQLRQKLHKLTDNISDQSSDEDRSSGPQSSQEIPAWRSPQVDLKPSRIPTRSSSRLSSRSCRWEEELEMNSEQMTRSTESPERKEVPPQEASAPSSRGSTAFLEELEDKVAQAAAEVQNAQSQVSFIEDRIAALNAAEAPLERRRRSAIPVQARRFSQNFPTNQVDPFDRNTLYRGSLTQRNPAAKPKTRAACAKPVLTLGS